MPAQVGPENREVRRFVELDAKIENPGAIGGITMKQDHRRRSFRSAQQPATGFGSITIAPAFVRCLQTRTTDLGKGQGRDEVSLASWLVPAAVAAGVAARRVSAAAASVAAAAARAFNAPGFDELFGAGRNKPALMLF